MLENDTREIETCCKTQYIRGPESKADRGPTKVLCFSFLFQSPTSSVEDLLPASWLEIKNNDGKICITG